MVFQNDRLRLEIQNRLKNNLRLRMQHMLKVHHYMQAETFEAALISAVVKAERTK
jgi:hypothetical protein